MNNLSKRFISEWGGAGKGLVREVCLYLKDYEICCLVGGLNVKCRAIAISITSYKDIVRPIIYFKNKYVKTENGEKVTNGI